MLNRLDKRADGAVPATDLDPADRASFPPPDDYYGPEEGIPGTDDYERDLTEEEEDVIEAEEEAKLGAAIAAGDAAREAWLAKTRAAAGEADNPPPPGGGGMRSVTEGEEGKPPEEER